VFPRLVTARLVLDAFTPDDIPALVELCGHPDIYATTLVIPRPYLPEHANNWLATHTPGFLNGEAINFAIRGDDRLLGNISLIIKRKHDYGSLGYWIGRPYWHQGYCTEALRAVLTYGFREQGLEKIEAEHFAGNDASGRVMQKAGLACEGRRPHHYKKDGDFIDAILYGITRAMAVKAGLMPAVASAAPAAMITPAAPAHPRAPGEPPRLEELAAGGTGSVDCGLLQRHFLDKNIAALEQELRVYGKSLAPDFAHLSPAALGYYLQSARQYLESEFSEGDWDFAHGLVAALAPRLRDETLPPATRQLAQTLLQHIHSQAARYFIEADQQPFAGWVTEALAK
jgi:RimJ/RimL family protein N-acetyltransferase